MRKPLRLIGLPLAGIMLLGLAEFIPAQKSSANYWTKDPYTENDEAKMKKAGYVSFGPFTWGDGHDTRGIRKMLASPRILFVETAHFKIGSTLPTYPLPKDKKQKKTLKEELTRLQQKIPSVDPKTRKLDPWLRLHLFAQRCEETYADFSKLLGVTDEDFEKKPAVPGKKAKYMGRGPHLGMPAKFTVLLLAKGSDLSRYAAAATALPQSGKPLPRRYNFVKTGSLFFGNAAEVAEGALRVDHAMHCNLVFNLIHSFVDGYKFFGFSLPVWIREGLGHHYVREMDPKEHVFSGMKDGNKERRRDHKWDVKTRRRLRFKDYTPAEKVLEYMSFDDLTFGDHMAIWSRVDFLLSLGREKFAVFMDELKDIPPVPGKIPSLEEILGQQRQALKKAWGFDAKSLDAAWVAYVKRKYPSR